MYRIAATVGRLVPELEEQLTVHDMLEWAAHFNLEAKAAQGIDPDCPFEPGDPNYDVWMMMKKAGAQ